MPLSKTDICNMALSHISVTKRILDIDGDKGPEASECALFIDLAIGSTLESQPWKFATENINLELSSVTNPQWCQVYVYPNFAARANFIINPASRTPSATNKIPFDFQNDTSSPGKLLLTDEADATLNINRFIDDPNLYPRTFALAVSLVLASLIASPLKAKDTLAARVAAQASFWLNQSGSQDFAEVQEDPEPPSEFVNTRA